ncbi:ATP-binding protein [Blastococcus deserti]|uniref:ATP-binding protein n=1 Tax=Blastococcus deserti TaxID=2259033 RepID=A0ABW4XA85_9ACTN
MRVALERAAGRSAAAATGAAPVGAPVPPPVRLPAAETPPAGPAADASAPHRPPAPRAPGSGRSDAVAEWRLPSTTGSIPALRRRLRAWLEQAGIDEDQGYDVLLAACEAATNAIEHAQDPTEPFVDVTADIADGHLRISVRDHGQWRERVASMDRGRGSTLMSAVGEVSATPSAEGTTVVISSRLEDPRPAARTR